MYITGYHGTKKEYAKSILVTQRFQQSVGTKEWLGNGIYFYTNFEDALKWAQMRYGNNGRVIHAVIKIEEDEILDYDTDLGKKLLSDLYNFLNQVFVLNGTAQENQCILANFIWLKVPNIKLLKASFATEPRKQKLLVDVRRTRTEFCVRDNDIIFCVCQLPLLSNFDKHDNKEKEVIL